MSTFPFKPPAVGDPTSAQVMCQEHDRTLLAVYDAIEDFKTVRFNMQYAADSAHDLAADDPVSHVDTAHLASCPGLQSRLDLLRVMSLSQDEFNSIDVVHDFLDHIVTELISGRVVLPDPLLRDEQPLGDDCDVGCCQLNEAGGDCDSSS